MSLAAHANGELTAWHYATRQPVRLRWEEGVLTSLDRASEAPEHVWVAPALLDLQINGFAGIDFQRDDISLASLLKAANALETAGCGGFLLTLMTDEWSLLMRRLARLRELRDQSPVLQQAILGWHIEGPFLSDERGYCGAHDSRVMRDPTPELMRELRQVARSDPVLLTLAPERAGAIEAIAEAVKFSIKVSLGHTNAPTETLLKAIAAGATGFTHLGNGCPRQLDRHDNILWRVFEIAGKKSYSADRSLTLSLIPDKIHVTPPLFRLIHQVLPNDSIFYITDAMAAAGAPPGRYSLGRLELEVGEDQVVRLPGQPNFAGSALCPIDGVIRAAEILAVPWQEVWRRYSEVPAKFMKLNRGLQVGQPARFCQIETQRERILSARVIG